MKTRSALAACACFAFAGPALGPAAVTQTAGPKPNPGHVRPLPDLVITHFDLASWGKCAPKEVLFNLTMTVKNQGNASWSGDSNVFARDLKYPGWFTSVVLAPLAPGESRTLNVPVFYYPNDPAIMTTGAPHPFQATVNDAPHMPTESNYANNAGPGPATYMGKKVIMVDPPKGCGLGRK